MKCYKWRISSVRLYLNVFFAFIIFNWPSEAYTLETDDECYNYALKHPEWLWCDDFESDTPPLASRYFDFDGDEGDMKRISSESAHGEYSLGAKWQKGEDDAGHFMRTFGRNPVNSQSYKDEHFEEIFWRYYFKLQDNFQGRPDKFTRAFIFANPNWAQAMIAHVWIDDTSREVLILDPASGAQGNELVSTKWNDFENLKWLGVTKGKTKLDDGKWYCLEAHVKLNTAGELNGIFEFWLDNTLEARSPNIDWIGSWREFGINTVFFSNYFNAGSPAEQERYFDSLVISRARIGCIQESSEPNPPSGMRLMTSRN